ncbi:ABC transporter permease [Halomonas sp. ATCH28]|uniref:ABC transporter permease n=1 Tax=Halomonas gemina TaxID=2945105 RepID=A0ABT0T3M4_9GAMM|nr:ABC transporter permease [Halomonas gemina]MCL7941521.1 ABC transporter permease [Halomonas gemina]
MNYKFLLKNHSALAGAVITLLFLLAIIFWPVISPWSSSAHDFLNVLKQPSFQHPFGTDSLGRDVATRVFEGAQVSLLISLSGVIIAMIIGVSIGLYAGYRGGYFDLIVMRVVDLFFGFPAFVLALFLMVALGFGVTNVSLAIMLVYFPIFARITRNTTEVVKNDHFVQAAMIMGQSTRRILCLEILPNISAPILVQASVAVAFGIVIESGLSFIGLGVQPPTASLGVIMADGQEYFRRAPWVMTLTGLVITALLLGLNLLGDGLRDLSDPRLKTRES